MPDEARLLAFLFHWHGLSRRRSGIDGLRRTIRQLQGTALPVSELESSILRARLADYSAPMLDELLASGEVVWQGVQPLGGRDGEISLYQKSDFPALGRVSVFAPGAREGRIRELLLEHRAMEFDEIIQRLGGFPDDVLKSLWALAWNGEITAGSLDALRARLSSSEARYHPRSRPRYAIRKRVPPGAAGRWSLLTGPDSGFAAESERVFARARYQLDRYGVIGPRAPTGGQHGFDELLPLLEQMAARGEASRKSFPQESDPEQFLAPGAERAWNEAAAAAATGALAACDPANPFGLVLAWPPMTSGYRPQRASGARVLVHAGRLVAYLTRTGRQIHTRKDVSDPAQLIGLLRRCAAASPVYLELVDGEPPFATPWHADLVAAGFSPSRQGYLLRGSR